MLGCYTSKDTPCDLSTDNLEWTPEAEGMLRRGVDSVRRADHGLSSAGGELEVALGLERPGMVQKDLRGVKHHYQGLCAMALGADTSYRDAIRSKMSPLRPLHRDWLPRVDQKVISLAATCCTEVGLGSQRATCRQGGRGPPYTYSPTWGWRQSHWRASGVIVWLME